MIKSMTGFGKSVVTLPGQKIITEVRSLNSRQLDMNLKIPGLFRSKEPEVRSLISERLERGKVDLLVSIEFTGEKDEEAER